MKPWWAKAAIRSPAARSSEFPLPAPSSRMPPIVLLDETTSSLDADNEKEIHKALDALMKDKTVIVIAHRLNTIIGADQILVLDKGIISERGNHKELLAQNGWYARMISEQTKAREWSIA